MPKTEVAIVTQQMLTSESCADPGIFVRGGPSDIKKLLTCFFLSSTYSTEVKWRGSNIFHGGGRGDRGPTSSRGGQIAYSLYRNRYNMIFQGGGGSGPH